MLHQPKWTEQYLTMMELLAVVRVWGLGRMKKRVDFIPSAQWESYSLLDGSVLFIFSGKEKCLFW